MDLAHDNMHRLGPGLHVSEHEIDVRDFRTGCVETDYGIKHEYRDESDESLSERYETVGEQKIVRAGQ